MAGDTIIWTKWQDTEWERIFTSYISSRGLIPKELKKTRPQENPIKNDVQI